MYVNKQIFTENRKHYKDIHGVKELYKLAGNNVSKLRCTLRKSFNHIFIKLFN